MAAAHVKHINSRTAIYAPDEIKEGTGETVMESRVLKIRRWVATIVVLVALAGGASLRKDTEIGPVIPCWARQERRSQ